MTPPAPRCTPVPETQLHPRRLRADRPHRPRPMEAGTDHFGVWVVEISYGRIGTAGRSRSYALRDEAEARHLTQDILKRRASAATPRRRVPHPRADRSRGDGPGPSPPRSGLRCSDLPLDGLARQLQWGTHGSVLEMEFLRWFPEPQAKAIDSRRDVADGDLEIAL